MPKKNIKQLIDNLLQSADVRINGDRPWDIHVHRDEVFARILTGGTLAFGESYMDGWWDCAALDQLMSKLLLADLDKKVRASRQLLWAAAKARVFNHQNKSRSHIVVERHYDIGNELYKKMLDPTMSYSCGYWKNATTLEEAQIAKLDLICKKLQLKKGMTLLDIGCGWGGLAKFAAEKYNVKVVGITISKEQAKLAQERCANLDIEIRLQDYRDVREKFDCIASVGMFEHVGYKNYRTYFQVANNCLKNGGLFLLHTIGNNFSEKHQEPWFDKYIFPNSLLPSPAQISVAYEGIFRLEDWHNFGADYDPTLMAWHRNFNAHWETLKGNYDERFHRMWNYYLLSCAGSARARKNQLWQIVFAKLEDVGKYVSIR